MPPAKLQDRGLNLNTILILVSIAGGLGTLGKFILPLAVVPERVEAVDQSVKQVRRDVDEVSKVQAVQTDAVRRLADIAEQSQAMRRDVDKADTEIREVKRRLDRLESHGPSAR